MKLSKLLDAFGIGRKRKPAAERKARPRHFRSINIPSEDGHPIEVRIKNSGGLPTYHHNQWVPDSDGYPTWDARLMNHGVPCSVKREPSKPSDAYTYATTSAYAASTSYDSSPSSCDTSSSSSTSSDCSY